MTTPKAETPTALWPWTEAERREAARRERQVERAMLRCVHNTKGTVTYSEPHNQHMNICAAGIDHRSVTLRNPDGWTPGPLQIRFGMTMPCVESKPCSELLNAGGATCPKREFVTRAQAIERLAKEQEEADVR